MKLLAFVTSVTLLMACRDVAAPKIPAPDLVCAENSVVPATFQQYVREDGMDVDSFVVENRVTYPPRYHDTLYVLDGGVQVTLVKHGGRCMTLFDSILYRHNPPLVVNLD